MHRFGQVPTHISNNQFRRPTQTQFHGHSTQSQSRSPFTHYGGGRAETNRDMIQVAGSLNLHSTDSQCAPGVKANGGSCLTKQHLFKIAQSYNQAYPNTPIRDLNQMNRDQLWQAIRDRLFSVCKDSESCWLDQNFVIRVDDDESLQNRFKPKRPNGKYQWLDTTNIQKTMEQYETKYPDFSFIGPVPMNFSKLSSDIVGAINDLDLSKAYRDGIRRIGIVFNMSPWHPGQTSSGSHWVALWIDLNQRVIAFFDSFGLQGRPDTTRAATASGSGNDSVHCIQDKVQTLIDRLVKTYPGMNVKCNTIQHQRKNSECGVYAMYFITSALEGRSVDEIFHDIKTDEEMNRYRNVFFRP